MEMRVYIKMQMWHVKACSQHFIILHEKCYLRKWMHLDARARAVLRTQPQAGKIIHTQFISKMIGVDDQVRLGWYNIAKLLSQEIICFDATLIPLMIIRIVSYSSSWITTGSAHHRLSPPAYAFSCFMKRNIKVKHPPYTVAVAVPSTSGDFDTSN